LCPLAKEIWGLVLTWEHYDADLICTQTQPVEIGAGWEQVAAKIPKQRRRHFNGVVIYTFWNIWKERNRRIFHNSSMDARQVASRAKEDIELHGRVFNNNFS